MRSTLNCKMEQTVQWRRVYNVLTNCRTVCCTTDIVDEDTSHGAKLLGNLNCGLITIILMNITLRKLKNGKATGHDQIPPKLIKRDGKYLKKDIYKIILKIMVKEIIRQEWKYGIICTIHKGDGLMCDNYRAVALLCTTYKILANML